jgi:tetratricopeptide (TPR) repeat protein
MSPCRLFCAVVLTVLSPFVLAQEPSKALEYYSHVQEFSAANAAGRWAEAEDAARKALAISTVDGDVWMGFANSLMRQRKFEQAIEPYMQALDKGAFVNKHAAVASFNLAVCNANLGRNDEALKWLKEAFDKGHRDIRVFRNSDFAALKGNPAYDEMAADRDLTGVSRNEGLAYDLWFLDRELRRIHFAPYAVTPKDALDRELASIKAAIPAMSNDEFYIRARKYVAMVGDGHTALRANQWTEVEARALPVRFVKFTDGVFVTGATEEHKGLLEMRLQSIAGVTVDDLWKLCAPLVSKDNTYDDVAQVPALFAFASVLKGLKLAQRDSVACSLIDRQGRVTRIDLPFVTSPALLQPYQTGAMRPAYLKSPNLPYWYEYLEAEKTVYLQYNAVRQNPDEAMEAFMARIFTEVGARPIEKFVVDVRFNGGGNSFMNSAIQRPIMRNENINKRGTLFIITGRNTFSAAQNFTTDFMRESEAIFVGEPTGSRPNFVGETNPVVLPYTKMRMTVSDLYWQRSWPMDHRQWIPPDLPTEMSSAHFFAGRDPAMEAILAFGKG